MGKTDLDELAEAAIAEEKRIVGNEHTNSTEVEAELKKLMAREADFPWSTYAVRILSGCILVEMMSVLSGKGFGVDALWGFALTRNLTPSAAMGAIVNEMRDHGDDVPSVAEFLQRAFDRMPRMETPSTRH